MSLLTWYGACHLRLTIENENVSPSHSNYGTAVNSLLCFCFYIVFNFLRLQCNASILSIGSVRDPVSREYGREC